MRRSINRSRYGRHIESCTRLPTKSRFGIASVARRARTLLICLIAVAVSEPSQGQSPTVSASSQTMIYEGFTEPRYDIMVAATEIGRLETVHVEVGDRVQAGQIVGQLEDVIQASSVRIATLQTKMTGELKAAKADVDLHQSRTESLRKLAADGMARPDELVRAETDLRVASSRYLAVQEQLQLRNLELERFQLQLQRRKIRAPMDGVISQLFHQPGEYITPGDPAVVRLLVMDKLYAVFNIPVEDTATVQVGSSVRVFLRSNSTTIDASVSSIAPDIDGESGTVQVRVELDNTDRKLLAGDRCTMQLASRGVPKSARLPSTTRTWGGRKQ